jgi:hypothetical protein
MGWNNTPVFMISNKTPAFPSMTKSSGYIHLIIHSAIFCHRFIFFCNKRNFNKTTLLFLLSLTLY